MFDDEVFEFDVCLNWEMGGEKRHVELEVDESSSTQSPNPVPATQ